MVYLYLNLKKAYKLFHVRLRQLVGTASPLVNISGIRKSPDVNSTLFQCHFKIKYNREDRVGAKHMAALIADFDTISGLFIKEQCTQTRLLLTETHPAQCHPSLPKSSMTSLEEDVSSVFTE
jgi:hypothetical protein